MYSNIRKHQGVSTGYPAVGMWAVTIVSFETISKYCHKNFFKCFTSLQCGEFLSMQSVFSKITQLLSKSKYLLTVQTLHCRVQILKRCPEYIFPILPRDERRAHISQVRVCTRDMKTNHFTFHRYAYVHVAWRPTIKEYVLANISWTLLNQMIIT